MGLLGSGLVDRGGLEEVMTPDKALQMGSMAVLVMNQSLVGCRGLLLMEYRGLGLVCGGWGWR